METNENEIRKQIQREHGELRTMLGNVHQILAERLDTVVHVSEQLAALNEHVETHFNEEEIGGFFDQVLDNAPPELTPRVDSLRDEHHRLLQAVRHVSEQAKTGNGSDDWWQRLKSQFHEFSKERMHHEHMENELLQDTYEQDISTAD